MKTLFDLPALPDQTHGPGLILRPCAKSLTLPDHWYAGYTHIWPDGKQTEFVSVDPCPIEAAARALELAASVIVATDE